MTTSPAAQQDVRSRIVDAASRLLNEQGAAAVTTRGVAQAAGVQAPTIYRLFGDKDGLIDAVAEHVMATHVAEKAIAADAEGRTDGDPVADLRAAWRMHIDFGLANAPLYALLHAPDRASRSPAADAGLDVLRARVRQVAAAGLLRVEERRAVDMIHAAGTGAILALLAEPAAERDLDLPDALLDAVLARILAARPAADDTSVRTVAVTFATVLGDLPALTEAERALMAEWVARSLAHL